MENIRKEKNISITRKIFQDIIEVDVNMFDLENQYVEIVSSGEKEEFNISTYKKDCLINGYDDIDYLLSKKEKIEHFEIDCSTTVADTSEKSTFRVLYRKLGTDYKDYISSTYKKPKPGANLAKHP